ncbi:MAG: A/G-specific adenine glycosylase [Simkaniaceae bacterium]|nr:A/G-specific adenine glycosylase [Simkaniaceae bacterium]
MNALSDFIHAIRQWFYQHKRELPWRKNPTPYSVWVSEVMLQQTQVNVVIPYYLKWLDRFPTVEALAGASEEEVIKIWEGLGYYSRARGLLKGAQEIVRKFQGEIPNDRAQLESIPGIGPYTSGAILNFAFHCKADAIDGNVMRVLSRLFAVEADISIARTRQAFREILMDLLEPNRSWEIMESLIELGALVCQKTPQCHRCPVVDHCIAHKRGIQMHLPQKKKQAKITHLHRQTVALLWDEKVLLIKQNEKLMRNLWCFPYFESDRQYTINELRQEVVRRYGHEIDFLDQMGTIEHGFTRYRATLYPSIWKISQFKKEVQVQLMPQFEWIPLDRLNDIPFPSGHRLIKERLVSNLIIN